MKIRKSKKSKKNSKSNRRRVYLRRKKPEWEELIRLASLPPHPLPASLAQNPHTPREVYLKLAES